MHYMYWEHINMKYVFFALVALFLTACEDAYRYPCQDPDNWELKQCKKPYCSANGTCPEDLSVYEKKESKVAQPETQKPLLDNKKGACKC